MAISIQKYNIFSQKIQIFAINLKKLLKYLEKRKKQFSLSDPVKAYGFAFLYRVKLMMVRRQKLAV